MARTGAAARIASGLLGLSVFVFASPALAGDARTDGPEGSEIGHGGYTRPAGGGNVSVALDWGAALAEVDRGPPLFAGLTLGYWVDDWLQLEGSAHYLARTEMVAVLLGPRMRTSFYPLSASLGFKAGVFVLEDVGARFGLSPQAGVDLLLGQSVLLGLGYALDVPVGEPGTAHRVFMTLGYRF